MADSREEQFWDDENHVLSRSHDEPSQKDPSGYYAALGVSEQSSQADIRRAFLHLSQRYHTDCHTSQSDEVQLLMRERFQALMDAYEVLSDEKQRAAYDAAGAYGRDFLQLVPQHISNQKDIISYVLSLEREAELMRTAKMLSATSDVTLSFSLVPLTNMLSSSLLKRRAGEARHLVATPPNINDTDSDDVADGEVVTKGEADATQMPSAAPAKAITTGVKVKEAVVDGKKMLVLVPSEELQQQLQAKIMAANQPRGASERAGLKLWGLVSTVTPQMIHFQHSIQHMITPRLCLTFRSDTRSENSQRPVDFTTVMEFVQDTVNTYGASLRCSVSSLKVSLFRQRVLNRLWTMKVKLVAFRNGQMLQKLELALSRRLSEFAELENTLAWSLTEMGYFRTVFSHFTEHAQSYLTAYIGYHNLRVAFVSGHQITYGERTSNPDRPSSRGKLQLSINCFPITGQTYIGYEAWYRSSPLQHYGLSFVTMLPYSITPLAPPLFIVQCPNYAVVNQIHLLYARGKHKISIPIVAFSATNAMYSFMWLAVPLFAYRLGYLLYRPYARARDVKYYIAQRKNHVAEVDIAREKALLEQAALEVVGVRSHMEEDRKGGLVIINAQYGVLNPQYVEHDSSAAKWRSWWGSRLWGVITGRRTTSTADNLGQGVADGTALAPVQDALESDATTLTLDVTWAVQNFVRDSRLVLPQGTKAKLTGFCDPDPFTPERKQLKIVYWFRKKRHVVVVDDEEAVTLPQRDHAIRS